MSNTFTTLPITIEKINDRYLLLYTVNLMCLSAKDTLDGILSCAKNLYLKARGDLETYLSESMYSLEYNPKPPKSVYIVRKNALTDEYNTYLRDALREAETALKDVRRKEVTTLSVNKENVPKKASMHSLKRINNHNSINSRETSNSNSNTNSHETSKKCAKKPLTALKITDTTVKELKPKRKPLCAKKKRLDKVRK